MSKTSTQTQALYNGMLGPQALCIGMLGPQVLSLAMLPSYPSLPSFLLQALPLLSLPSTNCCSHLGCKSFGWEQSRGDWVGGWGGPFSCPRGLVDSATQMSCICLLPLVPPATIKLQCFRSPSWTSGIALNWPLTRSTLNSNKGISHSGPILTLHILF